MDPRDSRYEGTCSGYNPSAGDNMRRVNGAAQQQQQLMPTRRRAVGSNIRRGSNQ